jgi:hypothetical protein
MVRNGRPSAIPETEADAQKEDHAPVDAHCGLFLIVMKAVASQPVSSFRVYLGLRPLSARVGRLAMLKTSLHF